MEKVDRAGASLTNGAALAAYLGAGIGAFAMGFFVILNEAGLYVAPALYAPAGGVTGRTAFAVIAWLIGWAVLHSRWKNKDVTVPGIHVLTLALIVLGIVLTFPPVWALFS